MRNTLTVDMTDKIQVTKMTESEVTDSICKHAVQST